MTLGFDAGQDITFQFAGGADIGPFSATVNVPADLSVTAPDLTDPSYMLDPASALNLAWVGADASQTVLVFVQTTQSEIAPVTSTVASTSVYILCRFPDNGSAIVPQDLMSRLLATRSYDSLSLSRVREASVNVPLRRVMGEGVVTVTGSTSVSRSWSDFQIPTFSGGG